jgi:hypothetical protein
MVAEPGLLGGRRRRLFIFWKISRCLISDISTTGSGNEYPEIKK